MYAEKKELISIIVPTYNSAKYIKKCVESVEKQSYSNWELLIIDDGSTDNTYEILKELEAMDDRLHVFRQENKGPGIARNYGIDIAKGEYIVFIDSDDTIKNDYFNILKDKKEDVVFIDVDRVNENGKILKKEYMSQYEKLTKEEFLKSQITGKINWGGVRKAVRRELLIKNHIRYTANRVGEEAAFSFLVLYNAKNYSFIEIPVYNYIIRKDSQSHLMIVNPLECVAQNMKKVISEVGEYETYIDAVNAFFIMASAVAINRLSLGCNLLLYSRKAKSLYKEIINNVDRKYDISLQYLGKNAKMIHWLAAHNLFFLIFIISRIKNIVDELR